MKERERIVLEYIIKFKQTNGYSPTIREIAKGINTKSLTYVSNTVNELADDGYITVKENKPRTIRVVKFPA